MTHPLVAAARAGLAELADLAKAPDMQRYMKSAMPFRGVPKPARAQLARALLTEIVLPDRATWLAVLRELWHDAGYREERYLAVDLTGHRAYAAWQDGPGWVRAFVDARPGLSPLSRREALKHVG